MNEFQMSASFFRIEFMSKKTIKMPRIEYGINSLRYTNNLLLTKVLMPVNFMRNSSCFEVLGEDGIKSVMKVANGTSINANIMKGVEAIRHSPIVIKCTTFILKAEKKMYSLVIPK